MKRLHLIKRFELFWLVDGKVVVETTAMLVFVGVFDVVVAAAFAAVGVGDGEVGDVVEVRFESRLAGAVFADIGKGDVRSRLALLCHLTY